MDIETLYKELNELSDEELVAYASELGILNEEDLRYSDEVVSLEEAEQVAVEYAQI